MLQYVLAVFGTSCRGRGPERFSILPVSSSPNSRLLSRIHTVHLSPAAPLERLWNSRNGGGL